MIFEYLIDTNVVSETAKPRPDAKVLAWLRMQERIVLSAIGVYELARGIERTSGRKRHFLDDWLATLLQGSTKVMPFDQPAAVAAAGIEHQGRRRGHPLPERDLFILATAHANGLRLATRNLGDFRGHGVPLYNPFDGRLVT